MSKVVVVTSGKGGVGKTTSSASFAIGLAQRGFRTVVVDFDVGLRNLDIVMGCERRVVYDLINVINGEATLRQALIRDKHVHDLWILPASQTRDKDALDVVALGSVMEELRENYDYIICDSPAGIEGGAISAIYYADEAIITCNPEVSSVRDSDRLLGIISSKSKRAIMGEEPMLERLLVTRYNPVRVQRKEMLSVDDVHEILGIPLLGVIPESEAVLRSSNVGKPVILDRKTTPAQAYEDAIDRFLGQDIKYRFMEPVRQRFFARLVGAMA